MKKLFSIALAFLLVLSTIGVTIHKQYFHGELFSVALFVDSDCCCDQDCQCCYKESEILQLKDEFISSSHEWVKIFVSEPVNSVYKNFTAAISESQKNNAFLKKDKSPPGKYTIREYKQSFLL